MKSEKGKEIVNFKLWADLNSPETPVWHAVIIHKNVPCLSFCRLCVCVCVWGGGLHPVVF
jgi:hypothetical protein